MDFNYDERIIDLCKRIRHDAMLDRFSYKQEDSICDEVKHLIAFLNFCGCTMHTFIKDHLANLQPAMIVNEFGDSDCLHEIISTPFAVRLRVFVPNKEKKALVVMLERERENNWIYELSQQDEKQYASEIDGLSVLIDNMYVNESPMYRKSAAFALTMYARSMRMSYEEKERLVIALNDKYKDRDKKIVIEFLTDLISKVDSYHDYCDYKYGEYLYEDDDMKFIWGIKAYDDLSSGEANLYSMNDIELIYFKEKDEYIFSWERIYYFEKTKHAIRYYKHLIKLAKDWMISKGYDVSQKPDKTPKRPCRTVEDAYWRFRKKLKKEIK